MIFFSSSYSEGVARSILLHCCVASAEFIRSNYRVKRGKRTKGAEWWNAIASAQHCLFGGCTMGGNFQTRRDGLDDRKSPFAGSLTHTRRYGTLFLNGCYVVALPSREGRKRERERETPGNVFLTPYTPPLTLLSRPPPSTFYSTLSRLSRARIKSTLFLSLWLLDRRLDLFSWCGLFGFCCATKNERPCLLLPTPPLALFWRRKSCCVIIW